MKKVADTADGWRTPDASWLDMEEADKGKALLVNVVKAEGKRLQQFFTNEQEFQARKECKRKKKIEGGEYAAEWKKQSMNCGGTNTIGTKRSRSWMSSGRQMKKHDSEKEVIRGG